MPDTWPGLFEVLAPYRGRSACESTETVNRAEAGGGAARSVARTRPPQEPTRIARRLPIDRLGQVCWADKQKGKTAGRG